VSCSKDKISDMLVFIESNSSLCFVAFSVSFLICAANVALKGVKLATALQSSAVADARFANASIVSCWR